MSKLKHTPGPWKYTISKIHGRHQISFAKNGSQICLMWNRGKEETRANALLCVAAPEMLEAIINYMRRIEHTEEIDSMRSYHEFKKVIEKATGLTIEEVLNEP